MTIDQLPYERILRNYDSPTTFFYLDPPYIGTDPRTYDGWTFTQMNALAEHIKQLQGGWLLTVNDSPYTRRLFSRYKITRVQTPNNGQQSRHKKRFGELIIRPRSQPCPSAFSL